MLELEEMYYLKPMLLNNLKRVNLNTIFYRTNLLDLLQNMLQITLLSYGLSLRRN